MQSEDEVKAYSSKVPVDSKLVEKPSVDNYLTPEKNILFIIGGLVSCVFIFVSLLLVLHLSKMEIMEAEVEGLRKQKDTLAADVLGIENDKNGKFKELAILKEQLAQMTDDHSTAQAELKGMQGSLQLANDVINSRKKASQDYDDLKKRIQAGEASLNDVLAARDALLSQTNDLRKTRVINQQLISDLTEKKLSLSGDVDDLKALKVKRQGIIDEIEKFDQELKKLNAQSTEITITIQRDQKLSNKIRNDIVNGDGLLAKNEQVLAQQEAEIGNLKRRLAKSKGELKGVEDAVTNAVDVKQQHDLMGKAINRLKAEKETLEAGVASLEREATIAKREMIGLKIQEESIGKREERVRQREAAAQIAEQKIAGLKAEQKGLEQDIAAQKEEMVGYAEKQNQLSRQSAALAGRERVIAEEEATLRKRGAQRLSLEKEMADLKMDLAVQEAKRESLLRERAALDAHAADIRKREEAVKIKEALPKEVQ